MVNVSALLMGGLGNQLFQIFNVIAYSMRYGANFLFEYSEELCTGKTRPTYWNNFLCELKKYTITGTPVGKKVSEQGFNYKEIVNMNRDVVFCGYYQSYKYFDDKYDEIVKLINLDCLKMQTKQKYNFLFEPGKFFVSMHFRLGDYKNKPSYHPILQAEYYTKCLNSLVEKIGSNNINVLYFNETEDNSAVLESIGKIRNDTSTNINFVKVSDDISDWEQLIIMSLCDHNIIANSSFSWWGAYFNSNENKQVFYPSVWFGPSASNLNVADMCPNNWCKINI